jgi:hypothetical protein
MPSGRIWKKKSSTESVIGALMRRCIEWRGQVSASGQRKCQICESLNLHNLSYRQDILKRETVLESSRRAQANEICSISIKICIKIDPGLLFPQIMLHFAFVRSIVDSAVVLGDICTISLHLGKSGIHQDYWYFRVLPYEPYQRSFYWMWDF